MWNFWLHYAVLVLSWYAACVLGKDSDWIDYPPSGTATMTHYYIPDGFIASCGCIGGSTRFPTAALNQMAYGSSYGFGPACGKCFKLTLLNSYTGTPPFFPDVKKSIVVKITDLCPRGGDWCVATKDKPNKSGQYLNFDLAYPSPAIPDDFFPSNAAYYGYTDFGVWNITYETVDCYQDWAGGKTRSALGSVDNLGDGVCCPANPTGSPNNTCPSFSEKNGIPPNTVSGAASGAALLAIPSLLDTLIPLSSFLVLSFLRSGFDLMGY